MKKIDMKEFKQLEEQFLDAQKYFYEQVALGKEELAKIQEQIIEVFEPLEEAHSNMIQAKEFLSEFLSNQVENIEEFMENKSEKWHESLKGEAYTTWKENIQGVVNQLAGDDSFPDVPEIDNTLDDIDTEYEFEGLGENNEDIDSIIDNL